MGWKERYRQAFLDGVAFEVDNTDLAGGRRVARHDVPFQDEPILEDLGRESREHRVEGYLIGDDYDLRRNELQDVCEKPGARTLVHPYLGTREVHCLRFQFREDSREGRRCRISFLFVERNEVEVAEIEQDLEVEADRAADALIAQAEEDLALTMIVDGVPETAIVAGLASVNEAIGALMGMVLGGPEALVADFSGTIRALGDELADLARAPREFAGRVAGMIGSLEEAVASRRTTIEALLGLMELEADSHAGTSFGASAADTNATATTRHLQQVAAAEVARTAVAAAADGLWETHDEALEARSAITERLDRVLEGAGSEAYAALDRVASVVRRAIPPPDARLPRLATVKLGATMPSLVLAHQIYGDASRAGELVTRNRVRHPGFMPGGTDLEVLVEV